MMAPKSVVGESNPNAVRVPATQLGPEIAAVALALLDKREARTMVNKEFNTDIKKLEKRLRELSSEVKATGMRDQFQINFGSAITPAEEEDNEN
jgi:hypothetical protein